ncbi:MAG: hypothetical protein GY920_16895 [Aliivibrio sp.]|nr:hypothetical protein [Aliivibrio sp.]
MATKKRRLMISLPADVDEALVRFSEVTGSPQTKFVTECLVENVPTIHKLCDAIEAHKAGDMTRYQSLIAEALGNSILSVGKAKG